MFVSFTWAREGKGKGQQQLCDGTRQHGGTVMVMVLGVWGLAGLGV